MNSAVARLQFRFHLGHAHLDDGLYALRKLIAKGDPSGMPLAERAINEYWDVTVGKGRKSGLRLIQIDVLERRNALVGAQHDFAQVVNDYIDQKLRGE